jgi:putative membrane protein
MITRRGLDARRIIRYLGPILLFLLAYDAAITAIYVLGWKWVGISDLPLPLLGGAIAIIVTFRNSAAYARWWEARGLWGQIVNNSRNMARAVLTLSDDSGLQTRLVRYQIAYVLALRCSLLGQTPNDTVAPYVPPGLLATLTGKANLPTALQVAMGAEIATARRSFGLDSIGVTALNETLSELANAQGGLERIKRTPLPRQYSHLPRVFVHIYCLLLPIGLVSDLGLLTPLGSTIVGFIFLSLDQTGRDLEDPFEGTIHDIPMLAITRTIEIDLLQTIGASTVPERIAEKDGVLW